ncbi:hypothetical protein C8Q76DRAFT_789268 [Earliella scabrosa]|nr:hypothetical protein C8Q76DRAFT_789268 [Earliella scabrosa]
MNSAPLATPEALEAAMPATSHARFPVELEHRILDRCDMMTLYTCCEAYPRLRVVVQQVLAASRDRIIKRFALRAWAEFLDVLHGTNAVVTGMGALALILRDDTLIPNEMTIAVPSSGAGPFEEFLVRRFCAHQLPNALAGNPITARLRAQDAEAILWEHVYLLGPQGFIRVICSATESPLPPITFFESTALMNFFNRDAFGCAFPLLTLARRSLIPRWKNMTREMCFRTVRLHHDAGFIFGVVPGPLLGYDLTVFSLFGLDSPARFYMCHRSSYVCPAQERFFGDGGSFIGFFSGHDDVNVDKLRADGRAPFGLTAVWRYPRCAFACASRCGVDNRLIAPGGFMSPMEIDGSRFNHGPHFAGAEQLRASNEEADLHQ